MTGLSYAHWLPPHAETLRSTGERRPGPLVCHLWKCESAFFCRFFFPKFFHMVQWWTQCTLEGWLKKKPCVILQSYFLRLPGFKIFSSLWFLLKGWQGMIFWGSESEKFVAEKQGDFLVFGRLENRYPQSMSLFLWRNAEVVRAFWIWGSTSSIQLKDNFSTCVAYPKILFLRRCMGKSKTCPLKTGHWLKCNVTATYKDFSPPSKIYGFSSNLPSPSPLSDGIHLCNRCNCYNLQALTSSERSTSPSGTTWGEDAEKMKSHSGYKRSCYHAIRIYIIYIYVIFISYIYLHI